MRIRSIKPEFTRHEGIFDAEDECGLPLRLAYIGLWMVADREGRFKWRPRALKADVLPFDDVDFGQVLNSLRDAGFLVQYEIDGELYGWIPTFSRNQVINAREAASKIPAPPDNSGARTCDAHAIHENFRGEGKGKGKERKGRRPANPDNSGPAEPVLLDLSDDNQGEPAKASQGEPESKTPAADPLEDLGELSDFYDTLTGMILDEHPRATIPKMFSKRWVEWRDTLAKLHFKDSFEVSEIIAALTWCFRDEEATERWPGWRAQVQAVPQLRKRKSADEPSKFERIHAAWTKADGTGSSRTYRNAVMTPEEVAAWDRI